ncbi:hypothetical protein IWW57_003661, partial [Coemansia sp. S610]
MGYNLVLLSRTQSKLIDVEQQLSLKNIQVESYAVDFSKATNDDWAHIGNMVSSKEVGVLVNNVGVCHPAIISFMEESPEICKQMVN